MDSIHPVEGPDKTRMWTAKDDARYISPLFALPGYRHTIGVARSWHFIDVYGFIITGLVFVSCFSLPTNGEDLYRPLGWS